MSSPVALLEAIVGGALVFFVPGFAVAKALFPERRVRGPDGVRWAVELAALGLVLSVVLTVLVGYLLLSASPGGFRASWSDPLLEVALAAVAAVAFVAGALEGAYRAVAPLRPTRAADDAPGSDPWELGQRLDRLQRERRSLERQLAAAPPADGPDGRRARLEAIVAEETVLRRAREADYDL